MVSKLSQGGVDRRLIAILAGDVEREVEQVLDHDYSRPEAGAYGKPFSTLSATQQSADDGDIVRIKGAGASSEAVTLSKALTIVESP